jgi:hypothetical protein
MAEPDDHVPWAFTGAPALIYVRDLDLKFQAQCIKQLTPAR